MRHLALTSLLFSAVAVAAYLTPPPRDYQVPMNPGPFIPSRPEQNGGDNGELTISDILPTSRRINIFTSLVLDTTVLSRLDSTKPDDNTTLLAPLNSAMQALPRKPWEDRPGDQGVSASENEDKAAKNLLRFVQEHMVPQSPWKPGKEHKTTSLGGQDLWWEERGGKKVILPGEVVVDAVLGTVGNGEVWTLRGVINYPVY